MVDFKTKMAVADVAIMIISAVSKTTIDNLDKVKHTMRRIVGDSVDKISDDKIQLEFFAALLSTVLGLADYEYNLDKRKRDAIRSSVLEHLKDAPGTLINTFKDVSDYMMHWDMAMKELNAWFDYKEKKPWVEYVPHWRWQKHGNQSPKDIHPEVLPEDAIAGRFCERLGFHNVVEVGSEEILSPVMILGMRVLFNLEKGIWASFLEKYEIDFEKQIG